MADPFSFAIGVVAQIGISYLFPSEGPRLKDLKMSASTYGAAIPWVFGLTRVPGNMIWSLPIKEHKKKKGVGKGGAYNDYTYSCTFAMGLCNGPVKSILRIWADGKLIYDVTAGASGGDAKTLLNAVSGGSNTADTKYRMRFYLGDEDQLPDSAIEADRGVGLTPAYRGLAYILFDDINLSDFGNRIPQITAEVFVGSTEQSVDVTPIHEADDTSPLDTSYVADEAVFDWTRSYAYLRYADSIAQVDLRAARKLYTYPPQVFAFPGGGGPTKLLCAGGDSSVFVTFGDGTSVARLDPYSMQTSMSVAGVPAPSCGATGLDTNSIEYLMTVADDGHVAQLVTSTLAQQFDAFLGGGASAGPFRICGRDADTSGYPTFYILRGVAGAGSLILTKINGPTQTDVQTITGTSLTPGVALWDNSSAGVIMFWSDGSQAYVSKWSEDLGAEAWRTAITGYPTRMDPQARLLIGKIAWVHDGKLFILDTNTGDYADSSIDPATGQVNDTVGQVDWADYLNRYPEVLDAYNLVGWKVASNPQAYAQYDYYQGDGQAEGRTITYIGADIGQGISLTDSYAGASSVLQAFDGTRSVLICLSGIEGIVQLASVGVGVSVGSIVSRMLTEGGLPATQTDLTALYDMPVRGYGWASGTDIKNILDEMRRLYLFDLVEREGVMVAVARSEPDNGIDYTVETIRQGALGSSSPDATDFWQETRTQEADLPSSVNLVYMNYSDNFEASTARSQRISNPLPTMFSRQQLAMEINVVMTPSEAKAQVNKILYAQWAERTRYSSRLPWAYLNLDPADVINVRMDDGRLYNARLDHTEIGADYTIAVEAFEQDSGAYEGWEGITADGGGSGRAQSISPPAVAIPFLLNTPLLRDLDDTGGSFSRYYTALGNGAPGAFQGGGLYRSTDNLNYTVLATTSNDVEWGAVIGAVPGAQCGPFALDWKTKIIILPSVDWFDLSSITDDELWAGANACVIGDEVIQFRDAVENDDGTWVIWNLLRGRRGTEYACDRHTAGDRFLYLSNTTISLQGDTTTARGQARFFKGVGQGRSLQEAPVLRSTYEPRDLMPYAPADIRREVASGGDIDITWARRTRLGGNMQDGTGEVALAELTEKYEVYILNGPFSGDPSRGAPPTNYLRMYTVTAPTITYALEDQGNDAFVAGTDTLHLAIYQLSDAVGRGFPAARSITASAIF